MPGRPAGPRASAAARRALALAAQDRVRRPRRRAAQLLRRDRKDAAVDPGLLEDRAGELEPRALPFGGQVPGAVGKLEQLTGRLGEVVHVRRRADLVVHDTDLVALLPEGEHRPQEVLAGRAEEPGAAHDPAVADLAFALDRSPSIIGADVLRRTTSADGTGIKIAVVDDGIDQSNPSSSRPASRIRPAFRAAHERTTPKVIVAKVFPGPNAGEPGRLAVDPDSSFHGTHVAGDRGRRVRHDAPAGADHPR